MRFGKRTFVLSLVSSSLLMAAPLTVSAEEDTSSDNEQELIESVSNDFEMTIFHTNDIHASIDNFGKMAYFLSEQRAAVEHSLYLDAGDIFSGNPVVDLQDGEPIVNLLNQMNLDLMVIGNHEFDYGQDVFRDRVEQSAFNWISANTQVVDSSIVLEQPDAYEIFEFGDISVGVFGLTQNPPATNPAGIVGLEFGDYVETAREYEFLRDEVDVLIALNHIGYSADRRLAEEVEFFDLIIGGHSHTLLTEPQIVNGTPIVQAGSNSSHIGVLDISVDGETKEVSVDGRVQSVADLDEALVDETVQNLVNDYNEATEELLEQVVGFTNTGLSRDGRDQGDVALGNMITDAIKGYVNADIAVTNNGGIRASIDTGDITARDVFTVDPFGNELTILEITGHDLLEVMTYAVNRYSTDAGPGTDLQTSGMEYIVYKNEDNSFAEIDLYMNGEPLDLDQTYRLATNNFIASGGSGYDFSKATVIQEDAGLITSAIIQHLQDVTAALGAVDYLETEGRIQILPISERAQVDENEEDDLAESEETEDINEELTDVEEDAVEESTGESEEEPVTESTTDTDTGELESDALSNEQNNGVSDQTSSEASEEPVSIISQDNETYANGNEEQSGSDHESKQSTSNFEEGSVEADDGRETLPNTATATWTIGLTGMGTAAAGMAVRAVKKKR